jgi:LuxR family transcriptional regulator, maltose regulon positive regulatory protein
MSMPADAGDVLLEVRLRPPPRSPDLLRRPELVDRLIAGSDLPLVALTAPAGYGKSSLLVEWANAEQRPVAWLSLRPGDGEPLRLFTLMGHAVGRALGIDPATFMTETPGISIMGSVVPRLVAAIRAADSPLVMIVDNLHEVRDELSRDAVDLLAEHLPPGVQLAIASRQPVWLTTSARRVHRQLLELGPADLAFSSEQVATLLEETAGTARPEVVEAIVASTEGWAAGVYLSALGLRRRSSAAASPKLAVLGATDSDLTSEFIRGEVLSELQPDVIHFLRRTAVLEIMSGPLCDAVLDTDGSDRVLQSIARSNLLVIPIDASGSWYRSHPLLRTALLEELVEREPALMPMLHGRASAWWEEQGSMDSAIRHALAAHNIARAGDLAARDIFPAYNTGRLPEAAAWLKEIGDAGIEANPTLAVLAGWLAALSGRPAEATHWLERVEHINSAPEPPPGVPSFESNRAMLRGFLCGHGVDQMAADAEFAASIEPAWSPWKAVALGLLATSRWMQGDLERALLDFSGSIDAAAQTRARVPLTRLLGLRALMQMDLQQWERATEDIDRALAVIDAQNLSEYGASSTTYAAAARLALHHGDQGAARDALVPAMRLRELVNWATPWNSVILRLELARAHLALDDVRGAWIFLREIDDVLYHRPRLGLLNDQAGQLRQTLSSAGAGAGTAALSGAELRLLPYLQTHLTLGEIAERLYLSRHTVVTHAKSIYRKFGVPNRNEAVRHARAVGLLPADGMA